MTADLPTLKAAVDFRQLVLETRELDRNAKAICPFHDDHNPSCHIYPDGFRCYVCGARGDHLDWLQAVGSLTTAAAIRELERRAGDLSSSSAPRQLAKTTRPAVAFKPVTANVLERHRRQAEKLASPPIAVQQRGFESDDLKILGFAAHRDNDAVFPITSRMAQCLLSKYAAPNSEVATATVTRRGVVAPPHGAPRLFRARPGARH